MYVSVGFGDAALFAADAGGVWGSWDSLRGRWLVENALRGMWLAPTRERKIEIRAVLSKTQTSLSFSSFEYNKCLLEHVC